MPRLAAFVSSHGFGHATRTAALLQALALRRTDVELHLVTTVPPWLFAASLTTPFRHHPMTTDVGLVQTDALAEDLGATVDVLRGPASPLHPDRIEEATALVGSIGPDVVLADVSPLGLLAAQARSVPSVLVENFTWDWIYHEYADREPRLAALADDFARAYESAGLRIQTEPLCRPLAGTVHVGPISRRPRRARAETRRALGVPDDAPLVMVTMGGIEWDYRELEPRLAGVGGGPWLVVPGGSDDVRRDGHVVRLPHRSEFHHPDLLQAADAAVGKLGYSTVAEIHRMGIPFGYVPRPGFPESPHLERWVREHLPHRRIEPSAFRDGSFLDDLGPLLALPRHTGPPPPEDGAASAAEAILEIV